MELEPHMRLHLAQPFSNRAPRGRKHDFKEAERLVRRLIANELILGFVPNGEQRIWWSMTRMKLQLTRDRVRLQPDPVFAGRDAGQAVDCGQQSTGAPAGCVFCMLWPTERPTPKSWRNWVASGCSVPRSNWSML